MEYINNTILCLDYNELVPEVMTVTNYKYHKSQGNIVVHGVGGNGRRVLVEYETMPPKFKGMVRDTYGDPYQYASRQPILKSILPNTEARQYYDSYKLDNGDNLPNEDVDLKGNDQINYVNRYTRNAEWLDMLIRLTTDKRALKRELNVSLEDFWNSCSYLIKQDKVASLAASRKRLNENIKKYKLDGYESLIDTSKFGNTRSRKVADPESEAFLEAMLAHRNKHDNTIIAAAYNRWAKESDRLEITPAAVGYWRKKWTNRLYFETNGMAKTSSVVSKHIKRNRPTAPLLLINSDDNVFDVYFKNGDSTHYRPSIYVVLDIYNDYVLGYAWGDTITDELVKEAYRNAQRHIMELTGDSYGIQQLQTDRWHISGKNTTDLERFYHSVGTFIPAALKNAQSKYIERFFGKPWHQVLKALFTTNYSGHNITAKTQFNRDNQKAKDFPDIEYAADMIDGFIQAMRQTKRKDCEMTRQQEWLKAFNQSDKSKKKLLSTTERLQVFGKLYPHTNPIKADGLTPKLLGERREYDLSQQQIWKHIGKQVSIYYDEYDLSQVLVTDNKGLRFLASEYGRVPSAFADYKEGDAERIKMLQAEKATLMPKIQGMIESRNATLERAKIDAESRIQAGVIVKEITHLDQRLLSGDTTISEGYVEENTPELVGVDTKNDDLETFKKPLNPVKRTRKGIGSRF